jgi:hypothetical protein
MNALPELNPLLLLACAILGVAAGVVLLMSKRASLLLVATMLFFASIGFYADFYGFVAKNFLWPIPYYRAEIFAALGLLMYAWILGHWGKIHISNIAPQMVVVILMAFFAALVRMIHNGPVDGGTSIIFTSLTLVPLALALPAALDDEEQWINMLRLLALMSAAYLAASLVQLVVNRSILTRPPANRFTGLSGNPQYVAVTFSVYAVVTAWLLLFDPKKRFRLLWAGLLGAQLIVLAWTGSRTGAGMVVVGACFAFYRRFGKLVLIAPFALLAAYLFYDIFLAGQGVELVTSRLVSTENTREGAWRTQWQQFMASPIIGVGVTETESENSYLYAISAFGIGMGLLIGLLILVSGVLCLKLFARRHMLPPHLRSLADLTIAYHALYFAGGFFEGYMVARVGTHIIFMAIFSAIMAQLIRQTQLAPYTGVVPQLADAPTDDWEENAVYGDYGNQPNALPQA